MSNNGLLIDFKYCTGCHACEVACKQEHDLKKGQYGIQVFQMGPWRADEKKWIYNYIPVPTDLCDLCAERTATGRIPSCAHHCQAQCIKYGPLEELAKEAEADKRVAVYAPC